MPASSADPPSGPGESDSSPKASSNVSSPVLSAAAAYRWLALPPEALLRACRQSRFQGSGPGGQKRNRVYSGIRLTHPDSGLTAESVASRESKRNLQDALARLRLNLALSAATSAADPAETAAGLSAFRAACNPAHGDFPGFALRALHQLAWQGGQIAPAAAALGCTASALARFLKGEKAVWAKALAIREGNGLGPLK
jgi:hypothetical protein